MRYLIFLLCLFLTPSIYADDELRHKVLLCSGKLFHEGGLGFSGGELEIAQVQATYHLKDNEIFLVTPVNDDNGKYLRFPTHYPAITMEKVTLKEYGKIESEIGFHKHYPRYTNAYKLKKGYYYTHVYDKATSIKYMDKYSTISIEINRFNGKIMHDDNYKLISDEGEVVSYQTNSFRGECEKQEQKF